MRAVCVSILGALLTAAAESRAADGLTDKCNTLIATRLEIETNEAFSWQIARVAQAPSFDPDLYERLWRPKPYMSYADTAGSPTRYYTEVLYDGVQDLAQIRDEIAADPALRARGVLAARVLYESFWAMPGTRTLTEYRNTILDHYFLSSSPEENAIIDSGGAGPGWERTGETMTTIAAEYREGMAVSVHRFYAPGAHSHVFTPDPRECGILRKAGTGWLREGAAFGAWLPVNGSCPGDKKPVWRLYNNRAAQNDSNHRHVANTSLLSGMQLRGWALEGVAFCVNP